MSEREAMLAAGWRYDPKTDGWRKRTADGMLWVSAEQARVALAAAEEGVEVERVAPRSETIAGVVVKGRANDA